MEVILLEKIGKLGDIGDTVKVKAGFGRNFFGTPWEGSLCYER